MLAVEFFHQVVKLHQFRSFYFIEVFVDIFEGFANPMVLVPVVVLLTLDSREVLKAFDNLFMGKKLEFLEGEENLVW